MNIILDHREFVGDWLNARGLLGKAVEVGSADGSFAASILSDWDGQKLFLIDPWAPQPSELYPQPHADVDFEALHRSCQELAERDRRVTLLRGTSVAFAETFENWAFDFVYLDAAHDPENVRQDLDLWYPKLKRGGLFGGHDFNHPNPPEAHNGVMEAVTQWMREKQLGFSVTRCTSWWTIKQ